MENTGFYVIPNKTQYEIGERVWLEIKKTGPTKANHVKVSLFTYQGENLKMECGYLVKIEFFQKTEKLGSCYTAFDVVNCWTEAPRYGFLSSFSEEDKQKEEYQEFFREMHLNVIQFYDWMYRHDEFYPESDIYTDIMGRKGSMTAVAKKIEGVHACGAKAIAYGAVYGAESFQE